MRRLPVENWIGYLSPYIIFGLEHRRLGENLFDPPKNLFQQYRPFADIPAYADETRTLFDLVSLSAALPWLICQLLACGR
ncbi:MAG: hypothetical protein WCD52_02530, partial [Xanthobacteraceae bacterium]